ncbi:MAG: aldehyde ferredoxin oxidoreductase N-terminal domain-containing protein [Thermanaerothrix sp.]|uniref:aldehyde ferredoxin oxidoreductase N-terminal domain-containing protein n=1 Tax=Thermanaerothrix sp. TaxID=2972675 RepID=UPI003C7BAFBE
MEQKMLYVDLSKGEVHSRPIPAEWVRDFIGGEGVAMRLLWDLIVPDADGTDPRQPLIFATGLSSELGWAGFSL